MPKQHLTDLQIQHVEVMRLIAKSFSETPMVLKGGTALLLAYELDRYSEDLDFDSTAYINPESKIRQALAKTLYSISDIKNTKKTDTVRRWMIYYSGPAGTQQLKLEVSYRNAEIDLELTTLIDGIRVYKASELISQKLHAAQNRSKVRDLYDITYLAAELGDQFTPEQIVRLVELAGDPSELQFRYQEDHSTDSILNEIDLEELVLTLCQSSEELTMDLPTPGPG